MAQYYTGNPQLQQIAQEAELERLSRHHRVTLMSLRFYARMA